MPKLRLDPALKHISSVYIDKVQKTVRDATKKRINQNSLKLITNISDDMRKKIEDVLKEGETAGRSVAATASKLLKTGLDKGPFKSARRRAYLIARTELHRARQLGALDIFKAAGINYVVWMGIPEDGRICVYCKAKHGRNYHIDNIEEKPPLHPRCRCRLLPSDYQLEITPRRKGVTKMKITPTSHDYKYVVKLGKSLEKADVYIRTRFGKKEIVHKPIKWRITFADGKHVIIESKNRLLAMQEAKKHSNLTIQSVSVHDLEKSIFQKSESKYSCVLAELNPLMAKKVKEIIKLIDPEDLHEKTEDEDEPHITVLYGLHTEVPEDAKEVLRGTEFPLDASVVCAEVFKPEGRDYDVLVLSANSPDIEELNDKLGKLPNTTDFEFYHPHITVAYLKRGRGDKYQNIVTGLEGKALKFNVLEFSDKEQKKTEIDIEKARSHKYIKREGVKGNYKYTYPDDEIISTSLFPYPEKFIREKLKSGVVTDLKATIIWRSAGSTEALVEINGIKFVIDNSNRLKMAGVTTDYSKRDVIIPVAGKTGGELNEYLKQFPKLGKDDFPPSEVITEKVQKIAKQYNLKDVKLVGGSVRELNILDNELKKIAEHVTIDGHAGTGRNGGLEIDLGKIKDVASAAGVYDIDTNILTVSEIGWALAHEIGHYICVQNKTWDYDFFDLVEGDFLRQNIPGEKGEWIGLKQQMVGWVNKNISSAPAFFSDAYIPENKEAMFRQAVGNLILKLADYYATAPGLKDSIETEAARYPDFVANLRGWRNVSSDVQVQEPNLLSLGLDDPGPSDSEVMYNYELNVNEIFARVVHTYVNESATREFEYNPEYYLIVKEFGDKYLKTGLIKSFIILEKARSHKYIRREGLPGRYSYFYPEQKEQGITRKDLDDILNSPYVSSDEKIITNVLDEYWDDPDTKKLIAIRNQVLEDVRKKLQGIHYDENNLKRRLLTYSLEVNDYASHFPAIVYVSSSPTDEMTIGLELHQDGHFEMFEGNEEATPETLDLVNNLLGVGNKKIRVWSNQSHEIAEKIRAGTIPKGIFVSPKREVAEAYWGEGRELVNFEIPLKNLSQVSDIDWQVRESVRQDQIEDPLRFADRGIYETKSGKMVESPTTLDWKDLSLEDLKKLDQETIISVKFSGGRGGTSRQKIKVKRLILFNPAKQEIEGPEGTYEHRLATGLVKSNKKIGKSFDKTKFVLNKDRARAMIHRLHKSKVKYVPFRTDYGDITWAKRTERGFLLKNVRFGKGDAILLKAGRIGKITSVGKDGVTARDDTGNKYQILNKSITIVKQRRLEK